jgi:hypothetical protein
MTWLHLPQIMPRLVLALMDSFICCAIFCG